MKKSEMSRLLVALAGKDTNMGCAAAVRLTAASRETDEAYAYMEDFLAMTDSPNSYIRTRALSLIAANARWDADGKITANADRILSHITDIKPITSRQFIQLLPQLAKDLPQLKAKIASALRAADTSGYAESMRGLVEKDIAAALEKIEGGTEDGI